MITTFHAKNFKALRDISLRLTPIHVLIGPNDSGKTSILQALSALSRSVDLPLEESFGAAWVGRELVWYRDRDAPVELGVDVAEVEGDVEYRLVHTFDRTGRGTSVVRESLQTLIEVHLKGQHRNRTAVCENNAFGGLPGTSTEVLELCHRVYRAMSGVQYFRWNPRMLSLPVAPSTSELFRLSADGFGLALLLDDILGSDRSRFDQLESRFRSFFPHVHSIKLIRQPAFRARPESFDQMSLDQAEGKGLAFELAATHHVVPASQMSDGALLILDYLAVLHSPKPPRLLLIEEPENGIHPKRLGEVVRILRDIIEKQSHTQIVLTTHSPYAVDLFKPEEVTLCTKRDDGSISLTRLADTQAVKEQQSLFSLGEIWTAEGDEGLAKERAAE